MARLNPKDLHRLNCWFEKNHPRFREARMDKAAVAALARQELQLAVVTEGQVSRAAYAVGFNFEYDRPAPVEPGDAALAARLEVLNTRVQGLEERIANVGERNKNELTAMAVKLREYDGMRLLLDGLQRDLKHLQNRGEVPQVPAAQPVSVTPTV